jgi:hypothetical protein
MIRRSVAINKRGAVLLAALGCALFGLLADAVAQNACTKDELFGGYAALIPNGWGDLDYKINTIPNAFDASNTYYLPNVHNLGLLLDGSGHYKGGTTPPNLVNGSTDSTGVGYALGGLQYKFHGNTLSPFFRGFVGAANISPDCCHGTEWSLAAGGGGGLDLNVTPRISIRLIQADYIYTNYSHVFPSTHPTTWNSARLAAGLVINLGNYCAQTPPACTASASPSEVNAGEPVRLSSTGNNFIPKHSLTYGWTTTGGKLSSATTESSEVDTTGIAPGSYTATATIADPKAKTMNSAACPAVFVVKTPPPMHPPVVTCSISPAMIDVGQSATVTMTATSPDGRPLTYGWTSTGGQLTGNGSTATVIAGKSDAGNTITVAGTATDDRTLSANCSTQVSVPKLPEPCVKILDWGECTFDKDPRRPSRVDNDCKDVLDKLALSIQQTPGGKLVIVGYTNQKEAAKYPNLGAQRAENVEYYLTTDGSNKIDAGRLEAHQGGAQGQTAHFYFVPDGKVCEGQVDLGTAVDEAKVKGQTRTLPQHKKATTATPPTQ